VTSMLKPFHRENKGKDVTLLLLVIGVLVLPACSLVKPAVVDVDSALNALTPHDLVMAGSAVQKALEKSLRGQELRWNNSETGHSGIIIPEKTFLTRERIVCRSFRHQVAVDATSASYRDIACRSLNGRWQLLSTSAQG